MSAAVAYRGLTVLIDDQELAYAVAPLFLFMAQGNRKVSIVAAAPLPVASPPPERQGVLL